MGRTKGQKIPGLERKPKKEGGYFDELPPKLRDRARYWLRRLTEKRRRHDKPVTGWVCPLLWGQARRLAKNPPRSDWGGPMLAKQG